MEELIDVLDRFGNKTRIVKTKDEVMKKGDWHRAISVIIMNSDNEILFQKRSSERLVYPNLWSMFLKGHIESGEESFMAAIREIFEEIGIMVGIDELTYLYTITDSNKTGKLKENIFFDTYLLKKDISLSDIKMSNEVSDVEFLTLEEAKYLVDSGNKQIVSNTKDYQIIFSFIKNDKTKKLIKK